MTVLLAEELLAEGLADQIQAAVVAHMAVLVVAELLLLDTKLTCQYQKGT
jgi:hypothetical protein